MCYIDYRIVSCIPIGLLLGETVFYLALLYTSIAFVYFLVIIFVFIVIILWVSTTKYNVCS